MVEYWNYHGTDHFRQRKAEFLRSRASRENVARLHIGCGGKFYRGYENIDNDGGDVDHDVYTALPYADNSIEEILAVHLLEHLFPWKVESVLRDWYRVLKPGGKLWLEMPDLKKILGHFVSTRAYAVGDGIDALVTPPAQIVLSDQKGVLTMNALYGGENSEKIGDLHKWCWTFETLAPFFKHIGFRDIKEKTAVFHVPQRDFIIEGIK